MMNALRGMKLFMLIWFGQLVSQIGTAMTGFAVLIWAYEQTGEATTLALLGFFGFGTTVLVSPIAGVLVDRWDRRRVIILSDLASGLLSVLLLLLHTGGTLHIWHLYLVQALLGALGAFWWPAYSASITLLVPKSQYSRAAGLRSVAGYASNVLGPPLAGLVLAVAGLTGVLTIDVITFVFAVGMLLVVAIPNPPRDPAPADQPVGLWRAVWGEFRGGVRVVVERRGLLWLLLLFALIHFVAALTYLSILSPMVLARSGGDELALAGVQSALGLGGVVGGLIMSAWGGPRRKIHLVLGGLALSFLGGDLLFAIGQTPGVWALGGFLAALFIPPITSGNAAIWQAKIAPAMQGRVFSLQQAGNQGAQAIGYLLAGPLADRLFEPAMQPGGALANAFGGLVGTGPGAGMGLMFLCTCLLGLIVSLGGYAIPSLRRVESDLPDHEDVVEAIGSGLEAVEAAAR
ncbi:MAG: MFS transporter [Anaerolineae bacterium]|nr:MFS transporter [Anaerolineae bacterium]